MGFVLPWKQEKTQKVAVQAKFGLVLAFIQQGVGRSPLWVYLKCCSPKPPGSLPWIPSLKARISLFDSRGSLKLNSELSPSLPPAVGFFQVLLLPLQKPGDEVAIILAGRRHTGKQHVYSGLWYITVIFRLYVLILYLNILQFML